jgi:hydrogenase maturation protease
VSGSVVLGVGNPVLGDDGVGLRVADHVRGLVAGRPGIEVRESERGGLDLVDLLDGFDVAVVVDAVLAPGVPAGSVRRLDLADAAATSHLHGAHGVDLAAAVELGRRLGARMPRDVWVVGVTVEDATTLREGLSPPVEAAVDPAARLALALAGAGTD